MEKASEPPAGGAGTGASPSPSRIATASVEIRAAHRAGSAARQRRPRQRSGVLAIDETLTVLEELQLQDIRRVDRWTRHRLRLLERHIGTPAPRRVHAARTVARLHAALLEWQCVVLDLAVPARGHYPDSREDEAHAVAVDERTASGAPEPAACLPFSTA